MTLKISPSLQVDVDVVSDIEESKEKEKSKEEERSKDEERPKDWADQVEEEESRPREDLVVDTEQKREKRRQFVRGLVTTGT